MNKKILYDDVLNYIVNIKSEKLSDFIRFPINYIDNSIKSGITSIIDDNKNYYIQIDYEIYKYIKEYEITYSQNELYIENAKFVLIFVIIQTYYRSNRSELLSLIEAVRDSSELTKSFGSLSNFLNDLKLYFIESNNIDAENFCKQQISTLKDATHSFELFRSFFIKCYEFSEANHHLSNETINIEGDVRQYFDVFMKGIPLDIRHLIKNRRRLTRKTKTSDLEYNYIDYLIYRGINAKELFSKTDKRPLLVKRYLKEYSVIFREADFHDFLAEKIGFRLVPTSDQIQNSRNFALQYLTKTGDKISSQFMSGVLGTEESILIVRHLISYVRVQMSYINPDVEVRENLLYLKAILSGEWVANTYSKFASRIDDCTSKALSNAAEMWRTKFENQTSPDFDDDLIQRILARSIAETERHQHVSNRKN